MIDADGRFDLRLSTFHFSLTSQFPEELVILMEYRKVDNVSAASNDELMSLKMKGIPQGHSD
jgi:hypothetical protein